MRIRIALLIFLLSAAVLQADDKIASVQEKLKDQGFYYGEITGEKNADTTAAIRRYQIRNGLQINGELNDETLRSLQSTASASSQPTTKNAPSAAPGTSDLRDDSARANGTVNPPPAQPFVAAPQDRQPNTTNPGSFAPVTGGLFAGTPYENALLDVQRKVIVDAQKMLARRGLFRNQINGMFDPDLEFSLRAYQSRVGLPPTGRLDLGTLAALQLLPGADAPVYRPRRGFRPRPDLEPPVRGEWIRP